MHHDLLNTVWSSFVSRSLMVELLLNRASLCKMFFITVVPKIQKYHKIQKYLPWISKRRNRPQACWACAPVKPALSLHRVGWEIKKQLPFGISTIPTWNENFFLTENAGDRKSSWATGWIPYQFVHDQLKHTWWQLRLKCLPFWFFSQLPLAILSQITASCILKPEVQTLNRTSGINLGELINMSRVL